MTIPPVQSGEPEGWAVVPDPRTPDTPAGDWIPSYRSKRPADEPPLSQALVGKGRRIKLRRVGRMNRSVSMWSYDNGKSFIIDFKFGPDLRNIRLSAEAVNAIAQLYSQLTPRKPIYLTYTISQDKAPQKAHAAKS